jgi:hypothetical protein
MPLKNQVIGEFAFFKRPISVVRNRLVMLTVAGWGYSK